MIGTNACSTERARHYETVHLIARLAGVDGHAHQAQHVQVGNSCRCCKEVWPCYGVTVAREVIAAQGG